jgi:hypothetical protein
MENYHFDLFMTFSGGYGQGGWDQSGAYGGGYDYSGYGQAGAAAYGQPDPYGQQYNTGLYLGMLLNNVVAMYQVSFFT